jgi:hypothetical protein
MAKRDRIDHSIEFWSDKKIDRFLLSEAAIELLGAAIRILRRRKRFGLEHANALTLAVSLNIGISTVERLFRAVGFCFPYNIEANFGHWLSNEARPAI